MRTWPIEIPSGSPFTLKNIPFGIFSTPLQTERRVGAAIGDFIINLSVLERSGQLKQCFVDSKERGHNIFIFGRHDLNMFASMPSLTRRQVRRTLIEWLGDPHSPLFDSSLEEDVFIPMNDAQMHIPFSIGGFTDFMCADVHIENCSRLAGAPVPPSHYAMPLGYNSQASSIIVSGEPIRRPQGMVQRTEKGDYSFAPSQKVDYEAELAVFVSQPVPMGETITADQADDHIFGFVILNDWSARDIQLAEMKPLGPLNGKGFASSISPWVVTLDALRDSRCASTVFDLSEGGSTQAVHLRHVDNRSTWNLEVEVSVYRTSSKITRRLVSSQSNLRDLRWSPGQMVAHLASSGCGLRTGDLIGTGTISSPNDSPSHRKLGCLFELTDGGRVRIGCDGNEQLTWLEDGDEVVMTVRAGGGMMGLGTLRSQLLGPRLY